jgi:hypothetical protein
LIRRFLCGCLFELQELATAPGQVVCWFGARLQSHELLWCGWQLTKPGHLFGRAAWRWFDDLIE